MLILKRGEVVKSKSVEELEQELADKEAEAKRLKGEIEKAKQARHAENIEKVRHLMDVLGVTLSDLKSTEKAAKKARVTGAKLPPKYRDPATGETWSGRGSVPNWVKAYEAQGRKREEFLA